MKVESPSVTCKDCGDTIEVYIPDGHIVSEGVNLKTPEGQYVCDECMYKRAVSTGPMVELMERDGGRHLSADTDVIEVWRKVMVECEACGTQMWGIRFKFNTDREIMEPTGDRRLYPAGTVAEFVECPNPACSMAWGTSPHHDNINTRYRWLQPPWVLGVKGHERARNPRDLRRAQRRANRKWWAKVQREQG